MGTVTGVCLSAKAGAASMGQSAIKSDTNLVQIEAHDAVFMTAALLSPMHLGFDRFVTDS